MLDLTVRSYRYPGFARTVLRDVAVHLDDGEMVGLVGPNEAGKSTLCLVASGLAPGSVGGTLDGELVLDGVSARGRPVHELVDQVAIGFQNPATQLSGVTGSVLEEVALGPLNLGCSRDEAVRRAVDALGTLAIAELVERDPSRLSGGQAQLVALASLLALRPRHLILDEPTAQLDPEGTRLVGAALRRLATTGTAVLVAEHKTDLLDGLCSRVLVIDEGAIALEGPASSVLEDRALPARGVQPPARVRLARALEERALPPAVRMRAVSALAELAAEEAGATHARAVE